VQATSLRNGQTSGTLALTVPQGWTVTPASIPISLTANVERVSATFQVTAPARRPTGRYDIALQARVGDATYAHDLQVIAYPHIQTHRIYSSAVATVQVVDLAVAPVRVGYIMGSGDQVPDALPPHERSRSRCSTMRRSPMATWPPSIPSSSAFVPPRRDRPSLRIRRASGSSWSEAERSSSSISSREYIARSLPPYPAQMMGNSRVTDENAAVSILAPQHAAFTVPNRISARTFDGWVQERNLYSFTAFDPKYVPLLEAADPGEMPQRGGEVYARVGRGHYVYTSYAWFRQLPAGVPGAYRLFANLISLGKAPVARRFTSSG
jgi:hypothetical protein